MKDKILQHILAKNFVTWLTDLFVIGNKREILKCLNELIQEKKITMGYDSEYDTVYFKETNMLEVQVKNRKQLIAIKHIVKIEEVHEGLTYIFLSKLVTGLNVITSVTPYEEIKKALLKEYEV